MDGWLKGKTAIVIGERDGVQGPSIAKCLEAAGANVVYAVTECLSERLQGPWTRKIRPRSRRFLTG